MKSEKLLYAIGKIDDTLIQNAAPGGRKPQRATFMKWGAVAACLLLLAAVLIPLLAENRVEPVPGDVAPMVFVGNTLYQQSATQASFGALSDEFVYLGTIQKKTDPRQVPNEELQANDNIVGAAVYQYGNGIVVLINGKYWLYEKYGA